MTLSEALSHGRHNGFALYPSEGSLAGFCLNPGPEDMRDLLAAGRLPGEILTSDLPSWSLPREPRPCLVFDIERQSDIMSYDVKDLGPFLAGSYLAAVETEPSVRIQLVCAEPLNELLPAHVPPLQELPLLDPLFTEAHILNGLPAQRTAQKLLGMRDYSGMCYVCDYVMVEGHGPCGDPGCGHDLALIRENACLLYARGSGAGACSASLYPFRTA